MATELYYGPHKIRIENDSDLSPLLERIQEVANSGVLSWVEISTDGAPHRILVQPGVPIWVVGKPLPRMPFSV